MAKHSVTFVIFILIAAAFVNGAKKPFHDETTDDENAYGPEPPEKSRLRTLQMSASFRPRYTGGLRLTGGDNRTFGIVEVTYNNIWGTICDDGMQFFGNGKRTARRICQLLGFTTLPKSNVVVAQSTTNKIWLDDFHCFGWESNIDKCFHQAPGFHNCVASENLGVICDSTAPFPPPVPTKATTTTTSTTITKLTTTTKTQTTTKTTTTKQLVTTKTAAVVSPTCGRSKYGNNSPGLFIVGGVIAQPNQYPWIARLSIRTSSGYSSCGGSIISKSHILTAAHCIDGVTVTGITAYLGDHNSAATDPGEVAAVVASWTKHPLYSSRTSDYDLAILRLKESLTFDSWAIQPICLPSSCDVGCTSAGKSVYISGWGRTAQDGSSSQYLRSARVEIADMNTCRSQYGSTLTERMLCAGFLRGGVDTCQGDSGGPLVSSEDGVYKLCGVTSFGNGCALPNYYGVYSKVCSQLSWIKTNGGL